MFITYLQSSIPLFRSHYENIDENARQLAFALAWPQALGLQPMGCGIAELESQL